LSTSKPYLSCTISYHPNHQFHPKFIHSFSKEIDSYHQKAVLSPQLADLLSEFVMRSFQIGNLSLNVIDMLFPLRPEFGGCERRGIILSALFPSFLVMSFGPVISKVY